MITILLHQILIWVCKRFGLTNQQKNIQKEYKIKDLEPGWLTEAEYVRAVDGDTIEVEVRRRFNVRLRDIDVYEKNTEIGKEATEFVDTILGTIKRILVFIPSNDPIKLMDINSFERLVGDIYVNQKNLKDMLLKKGYNKNGKQR